MLRLLPADERRALLAHEAAHLRRFHTGYVLLASLAAAANPLLCPVARQVRLAVELWADQIAAHEVGDARMAARALARASLAASRLRQPGGSRLAAAGPDVRARVHALTHLPPRFRPWAGSVRPGPRDGRQRHRDHPDLRGAQSDRNRPVQLGSMLATHQHKTGGPAHGRP